MTTPFGADQMNPDNWLVQQAEQLSIPALPPDGMRVRNEPNTVVAPPGAATSGGSLSTAIDAAMNLVGTPYVWGGTTANGVDCSGLVYYAYRAAGYNMQRYRAIDYGHMGVPVATADGRPGDIVYYDNAGTDTDHVGIYLGGGKFIEAPQPGSTVQVAPLRGGAQIRRIMPESSYAGLPTTADGRQVYNAADGRRYVGGMGFGPQRDPTEMLSTDQMIPVEDDLLAAPSEAPQKDTGDKGGEFDRFLNAVSGQESGGDYSVRNSAGAIGKYQVMYFNVGSWTLQALGRSMSPEEFRLDPKAQDAVARWRLGSYVRQYGYRGAAAAWYSGNPNKAGDYTPLRNRSGPSVGAYVDQVLGRMGA